MRLWMIAVIVRITTKSALRSRLPSDGLTADLGLQHSARRLARGSAFENRWHAGHDRRPETTSGSGDPGMTAREIGGVAYSPGELRKKIRKIRSLTDKPFGVDLLLAPNFLSPRGNRPMQTAPGRDRLPQSYIEAIARIAKDLEIELIEVPDDEEVMGAAAPAPVIAAGGIAGGRALAGVLAIGAAAAWCGTAFLVSEEANQPDLQKDRILAAAAEDTIVTRLYSGKTMRNVSNPLIEAWEREGMPALPMGAQGVLIRDLTHSIRMAGRHELLMNALGQTAGMLKQRRPAAEIVEEMVGEAAAILGVSLKQRIKVSV